MTIPKNQPVSAFGPELLALLMKGSIEEVTLELPTFSTARYLQSRLHALRAAMRREKHPKLDLVQRAKVSLLYGAKAGYDEVPEVRTKQGVVMPHDRRCKAKLYLRPQDFEFRDALARAGIVVDAGLSAEGPEVLNTAVTDADKDWINRLIDSSVDKS